MNLVLNTLGAGIDSDKIRALLPEKEVEIIDTSDMKIAHCIGCNQCWLRTPGICAIKDDYETIVKKMVGPTVCGSYPAPASAFWTTRASV